MPDTMPTILNSRLLPYKESVANIKYINSSLFSIPLWLEMPKDIAKDLTLEQVKELGIEPIDIPASFIKRNGIKPWLVIDMTFINLTPGFHMLQFVFYNNLLDVYQSYYFSYMVQVDNPDKSYIYMERKDTT